MKFKVGDKVRVLNKTTGNALSEFYSFVCKKSFYRIIEEMDGDGDYKVGIEDKSRYFKESDLELYNNKFNNKIMDIKEKFVALFIKEPEKTFRKAGITNGDGFLTDDGRSVFESYLLNKFGDDFKKEVVDLMLKEEKGDE